MWELKVERLRGAIRGEFGLIWVSIWVADIRCNSPELWGCKFGLGIAPTVSMILEANTRIKIEPNSIGSDWITRIEWNGVCLPTNWNSNMTLIFEAKYTMQTRAKDVAQVSLGSLRLWEAGEERIQWSNLFVCSYDIITPPQSNRRLRSKFVGLHLRYPVGLAFVAGLALERKKNA